jgi:hypothetical protein
VVAQLNKLFNEGEGVWIRSHHCCWIKEYSTTKLHHPFKSPLSPSLYFASPISIMKSSANHSNDENRLRNRKSSSWFKLQEFLISSFINYSSAKGGWVHQADQSDQSWASLLGCENYQAEGTREGGKVAVGSKFWTFL